VVGCGCEIHPITWWRERGEKLGKAACYTEAQVAEYRLYFELFAARDAAVFPEPEPSDQPEPAAAE
jgi:hypothetical protein